MSRSCLALAALAVLLAGCATAPEPRVAAAPDPSSDAAEVDPARAYMQRVEAVARRRGIGVIWVNPPARRAAAASDGGS